MTSQLKVVIVTLQYKVSSSALEHVIPQHSLSGLIEQTPLCQHVMTSYSYLLSILTSMFFCKSAERLNSELKYIFHVALIVFRITENIASD